MAKKSNELNNIKKYHRPGCPSHIKCIKNAVVISSTNTLMHELAKTKYAWLLKKKKHKFITEACPNDRPNRRIDLVDITSDPPDEYEFENSGKFKPDNDLNFKIVPQEEWEAIQKLIKKFRKEYKEILNED